MHGVTIGLWLMIWLLLSMLLTIPLGAGHVSAIVFSIGMLWLWVASFLSAVRHARRLFASAGKAVLIEENPELSTGSHR